MLKGQHFPSDAKVEAAVCKWNSSQPETFFMDGMNKCMDVSKCVCVCVCVCVYSTGVSEHVASLQMTRSSTHHPAAQRN